MKNLIANHNETLLPYNKTAGYLKIHNNLGSVVHTPLISFFTDEVLGLSHQFSFLSTMNVDLFAFIVANTLDAQFWLVMFDGIEYGHRASAATKRPRHVVCSGVGGDLFFKAALFTPKLF
jgi:hypothetical protein